MSEELVLNGGTGGDVVLVGASGALLVEGIEDWINNLSVIPKSAYYSKDGLIMMQDNKTGAKFLVGKVNDQEDSQ